MNDARLGESVLRLLLNEYGIHDVHTLADCVREGGEALADWLESVSSRAEHTSNRKANHGRRSFRTMLHQHGRSQHDN